MERSVRNNSALAHCSTACLPCKVQMAGVCLDVLLLRGGRCAANPWCARIFRRPRHAAHWSVSLHRCSAAVGLAVGFVFQPFPKNRDVARTDLRSVRGDSTTRYYRLGFATALRGSFVSGHGMARFGMCCHFPKPLPPSAQVERCSSYSVFRCRSHSLYGAATTGRVGSNRYTLRRCGTRRAQFPHGVQHSPIDSRNDS